MKLGFQFYRHNLIKVAILSCACLFLLWDWAHGRAKVEPAAGFLLLFLMVAGNLGLFLAMRRAKRREDAEKSPAAPVSAGAFKAIDQKIAGLSFDEAVRKRKRMRLAVACWALAGGALLSIYGKAHTIDGIPANWFGYVLIAVGILGLLEVNVFYGGPLDLRLDRRNDPEVR